MIGKKRRRSATNTLTQPSSEKKTRWEELQAKFPMGDLPDMVLALVLRYKRRFSLF